MLACITTALFFVSFNVYFVHMGNWMIYRMGFNAGSMGIIQGLSLVAASLPVIPAIGIINKRRTPQLACFAIILNIVGLCILSLFAKPSAFNTETVFCMQNIPLFLSVFLAGAGQILVTQSMTIWVKELYPETARGQFEGIRILFFVLTPMIIGTVIGNIIVKNGAGSIANEFGIIENIPVESIYLWGAILAVTALFPLFFASKMYNRRRNDLLTIETIT